MLIILITRAIFRDIDIDDIGDVTDSILKNITSKNVSHILRDTVAINRPVLGRETSQGILTLTPPFFWRCSQ